MLRKDDRGVVAIGQTSHAWISGQLARRWGNGPFGPVEPWEEVCLAAEQHDIGMAAWDLAPTLNPSTGLPHSFLEMPLRDHLGLWSAAPRQLLAQSRYAALLVSMHGSRLYRRRRLESLEAGEAAAVRAFLAEQQGFQDELREALREDVAELVTRNSQLLWIWDYLSLALCVDWIPATLRKVPTATASVDVELSTEPFTLEPWPFSEPTIELKCDGRRLTGTFDSEEEMRAALAQAPWETIAFVLSSR